MRTITVDVWLYGPLARYADGGEGTVYANRKVELPDGSNMRELLARLGVPTEERGITFVNGRLTALPGRQPDLHDTLSDGDRVALFHLNSMWPFQYRHGAALGRGLERSQREEPDLFHHRTANRPHAEE